MDACEPLTADLRLALRLAIDRARRETIRWDAEPRCIGCGVEQADPFTGAFRYVAGCRTCTERRWGRHRRQHAVPAPVPAQLVLELT